jgi:hypothetical protein
MSLPHIPSSREQLDTLLDNLRDGSLTSDDLVALRVKLTLIRDHSGQEVLAFEVYPGDQIAAAILLRIIDNTGVFTNRGVHSD